LTMRAEANRQRHAVVYVVELTTDTVDEIRRLLEEKDFKRALVTMKTRCLTIGFPDRYKESYERSWKMIPNEDLDPHYTDNPSQAKSNKYAPRQTSTQDSSESNSTPDVVTLLPPNSNKPPENGTMVRIVGKSKPQRDYSYTQMIERRIPLQLDIANNWFQDQKHHCQNRAE
jgi:hypothetical protein